MNKYYKKIVYHNNIRNMDQLLLAKIKNHIFNKIIKNIIKVYF
jgi:hypothetical protein